MWLAPNHCTFWPFKQIQPYLPIDCVDNLSKIASVLDRPWRNHSGIAAVPPYIYRRPRGQWESVVDTRLVDRIRRGGLHACMDLPHAAQPFSRTHHSQAHPDTVTGSCPYRIRRGGWREPQRPRTRLPASGLLYWQLQFGFMLFSLSFVLVCLVSVLSQLHRELVPLPTYIIYDRRGLLLFE